MFLAQQLTEDIALVLLKTVLMILLSQLLGRAPEEEEGRVLMRAPPLLLLFQMYVV